MKRSIVIRAVLLLISLGMVFVPARAAEKAVTLSTQDGWQLAAVYSPAQEEKRTVILLHDLGKNKEAFTSFKKALSHAGIGYLALDLRGHGQSVGGGKMSSFEKEGVGNPFNKMTRDVDAAVAFLESQRVPTEQLVLLGCGLGANVAAKSTTLWPDIPLVALISPSANTRDVLTIPSMRVYKGSVLIAAGAADKKLFLEASVIRNVAFLTMADAEGKVTFLTAYDKVSHEMLDQYLTPSVLQWIKTPQRPEVKPDTPALVLDVPTDTGGSWIAPSDTEEALVPSVLE